MSELGRPSGQNIAAPLFDKCIEQLGAEVARAHENERGRWTSQGLFCARWRARRSLGTTEGGEHARSSCAPRGPGPTLPFSLSSIRKGGRRMAKCRLLFPPSFLSLSLPRPVSTSCRPRKVGKYFLLALFPDPTTATADFHVPPERRAVSITPSPFLPLR